MSLQSQHKARLWHASLQYWHTAPHCWVASAAVWDQLSVSLTSHVISWVPLQCRYFDFASSADVWVDITRRAPRWQLWHPPLLLGSPCTTGSLFPILSFNLPFEQYGKSQHGIFTAVLEPRYPQNTCKLNEPFFFFPPGSKVPSFSLVRKVV